MKRTILALIALMLLIAACTGAGYKDCGDKKECVVESLAKGEKAQATLTETQEQGGFSSTTKTLVRSEGKEGDKVVIYQEILELKTTLQNLPPLSADASEEEKQQYDLGKQMVSSFAGNFEKLQGTSLKCKLDPAKVEALGVDDAVSEAMQSSIDPVTLKPAQNAPCSGTMLEAFANIMNQMIQLISQALQTAVPQVEQ